MSSYINFFVKTKNGEFTPIGSYSRSTEIYQELQNVVPYEHISPLSLNALSGAAAQLRNRKISVEKDIKEIEEGINQIATFNNSINEKLEAISKERERLSEYKELLSDYEFSVSIIEVYEQIIYDVMYEEDYNRDKYIYAGIEISHPTAEDVVDDK